LRNSRKLGATNITVIFLALIALSALTWTNYQYAQAAPGGNDFLTRWLGTRLFITEGLSPYSDEVAERIQQMTYGRPANPGEDELRFAYPLYSALVFIPYALISDYSLARAVWMTVLEVALVLLAVLSIRLTSWKISLPMVVILLLFSVFWYHGIRPLINGNAVALIALGITAGLLAVKNGSDELAGVLFALTTIKPQVVVLLLAFITIWALYNRRFRIVGWMFATVFLLSLFAALFIPNWILQNLSEVLRYPGYTPPGSPMAVFIAWWPEWGARVGWAFSGLMAIILLMEWWKNRNADFRGFLWTVCLTLVISQWIGIQTDPGNFVILFPGIIFVYSLFEERWKGGGRVFTLINVFALLVGIWALFLATVEQAGQPVQSPIMFFPLPAYLLFMLYWVRWWAVNPPTVWYDSLEAR
jgi:hypothetical protein